MELNRMRGNDDVVDLESGGTTSEEDLGDVFRKDGKSMYERTCSGYLRADRYYSSQGGLRLSSCSDGSVSEISGGSLETLPDTWMTDVKQKLQNEKYKSTSSKKAAKPPRPPKGPSLDATDMKFVREVSELAMIKRARIERMRILKQKKADKGSSTTGSIFAMLITLIFCYVIIFQGFLGSRS